MKNIIYVLALAAAFSACNNTTSQVSTESAVSHTSQGSQSLPEDELGWDLGAGSYSFKLFTFFEALDKIDSCGLKNVEGFPNHTIGEGIAEKLDYRMEPSLREKVLARLQEKGIKMNAYGVSSPDNEEDWRRLFEFAKAMGVETISSEPDEKFMPLISQLCDEFEVNLAIHNHATPSKYWDPKTVLATIEGYSERVGACADIGHWVRSGLDPIESLKVLEGRLFHLHMKDLTEKNKKEAHDVHWGTGVVDLDGLIAELKRQGFKGSVSAEYEHNWENNAADIAASIQNFRNAILAQKGN